MISLQFCSLLVTGDLISQLRRVHEVLFDQSFFHQAISYLDKYVNYLTWCQNSVFRVFSFYSNPQSSLVRNISYCTNLVQCFQTVEANPESTRNMDPITRSPNHRLTNIYVIVSNVLRLDPGVRDNPKVVISSAVGPFSMERLAMSVMCLNVSFFCIFK